MKRSERKYVLDTNLFIEALRDAVTNARLIQFHAAFAPFEYLYFDNSGPARATGPLRRYGHRPHSDADRLGRTRSRPPGPTAGRRRNSPKFNRTPISPRRGSQNRLRRDRLWSSTRQPRFLCRRNETSRISATISRIRPKHNPLKNRERVTRLVSSS